MPRYLEKFGEAVLNLMIAGGAARIAHLGCRTGYPDREVFELIDTCSVVGIDASIAAIELARNKAATLRDLDLDYQVATGYPTELDAGTFSHAMCLHPIGTEADRADLFAEMERLLYRGGQALVSLPLRGSFQEIGDLFREYALKHDHGELDAPSRPAPSVARPSSRSPRRSRTAGFDDIDVDIRQVSLSFPGGRAFTEDPVTRLLVLPELQAQMGIDDLSEPMKYVSDALGKYWSRPRLRAHGNDRDGERAEGLGTSQVAGASSRGYLEPRMPRAVDASSRGRLEPRTPRAADASSRGRLEPRCGLRPRAGTGRSPSRIEALVSVARPADLSGSTFVDQRYSGEVGGRDDHVQGGSAEGSLIQHHFCSSIVRLAPQICPKKRAFFALLLTQMTGR